MSLLKKILVPIDGSEYSDKAVDFAVELAKKYGAKIILHHVIQHIKVPKDFQAYAEEERVTNPTRAYMRRLAEHVSKRCEEKVKAGGVSCSVVISEGPVVDRIIRHAQNQEVDLIVVGTRGLGAVKRTLLGSVSQGVIAHAPCAVTVVR